MLHNTSYRTCTFHPAVTFRLECRPPSLPEGKSEPRVRCRSIPGFPLGLQRRMQLQTRSIPLPREGGMSREGKGSASASLQPLGTE